MSHLPLTTVRETNRLDVPLILGFIRKKATFDGVLDRVEATEERLAEELFGPRPVAFVLFAEVNGEVVGFALYYLTFSSFLARPGIWLDDLFVDESARGQGAGRALLTNLGHLAAQRGYGRMEWVTGVRNEKGLAFYQSNGAQVQERVRVLRLDRTGMEKLTRLGTP